MYDITPPYKYINNYIRLVLYLKEYSISLELSIPRCLSIQGASLSSDTHTEILRIIKKESFFVQTNLLTLIIFCFCKIWSIALLCKALFIQEIKLICILSAL